MKKIFLIFISIFAFGDIQNVKTQIIQTKNNLVYTSNKISNMNAKLDKLVKEINKQKYILNSINQKIIDLSSKIKELQNQLKTSNKDLVKLQKQKEILETSKNYLQKKVINFIVNNYTLSQKEINSEKNLINNIILQTITNMSNQKMQTILKNYNQKLEKIQEISDKINSIKNIKTNLEQQKQKLITLKKEQYKKIQLLNKKKLAYKQKLQNLLKAQRNMQNLLSKLNIIKKKAALEKLNKKNELILKQKYKEADKIKVKDYGNLYMKTKIAKYKGEKTISPVKNATIIKKFGSYIDPIYHISIYNDSITLKTPPNARVRAIFNGKVVFVNKTHNNKMIVIKHNHNLYSIYAKLSRISPFIKKGYKVKKGEIIAKTDSELEFEITYKTYPINPLDVINLK